MVLIKPQLRIIEKHKLYLSRRPGFIVWLLLGITVAVFIEVCRWFIDNIFILMILLFGAIIFGLDIVGNWEDIMLDRNQNIAIVTKFVWSEKLFLRSLEKSVVIHLSDIRHIGASRETGLFFFNRNGQTITFNTSGLSRDEVQSMKKEIKHFLEANRIHSSGPFTTNLYKKYSSDSEYEDGELQIRKQTSFLTEFPFSYPKRSIEQIPKTSVHKRLSTPIFGSPTVNQTLTKYDAKQRLRNNTLIKRRNLSEDNCKSYVSANQE